MCPLTVSRSSGFCCRILIKTHSSSFLEGCQRANWECRDATAGAAPMRTFRASSCAEHAVECAARPGRHDCCCCRFVWIRARVIRGQELRQQSYTAGSSLRGARGREAGHVDCRTAADLLRWRPAESARAAVLVRAPLRTATADLPSCAIRTPGSVAD
jgi:hypothetical protein